MLFILHDILTRGLLLGATYSDPIQDAILIPIEDSSVVNWNEMRP